MKELHHQLAITWKEDYLKFRVNTNANFSVPNIHAGDIVIIMDDLQPPYEWRLGRIEIIYILAHRQVLSLDLYLNYVYFHF